MLKLCFKIDFGPFVLVYPFSFGVLRLSSVSALVFCCTCFGFDMIVMYNISFPDQA